MRQAKRVKLRTAERAFERGDIQDMWIYLFHWAGCAPMNTWPASAKQWVKLQTSAKRKLLISKLKEFS